MSDSYSYEFTPTTDEQIRLAFIVAIGRDEAGEIWDRWIAAHDQEVRLQLIRERALTPIVIENVSGINANVWARDIKAGGWDECFEWCSDMLAMPTANKNPYRENTSDAN